MLISSFQYTGWQIFFIFGSIASFFIVFALFSLLIDTSVYGELSHTYCELQTYMILVFFTFSYILIDNGMQMVDAEIRTFMEKKREQIRILKSKNRSKDETLDRRRFTSYKRKLVNQMFRYRVRIQSGFRTRPSSDG